ncbi:Imm10 family immunity protein [Streptomyces sp. NPDC048290]|uniref:Imm10 family immunity protein n=1 Tax=Streptomyces sp. NPDC048290 TaxID=3155811 RepID=UPI0034161F72
MTHRFTARVTTAEVDPGNDMMQAGVAEDEDGEGFFLLFMSGITAPDQQAVALGLDSHCLVTPDQGTAYGCVREVVLTDRLLTVTLDPAALDDLHLMDPEIEVELDAPGEAVARFRETLTRVLSQGRPEARPRHTNL